jgi:3-oxoacyl-[acyl-carrier-protein] synthase-3
MPGLPVDLFRQYFGVETRHYVIEPQTGERRHVVGKDGALVPLTTTEMGAQAALAAIKRAGVAVRDIDAIITNSTTPDSSLPPFALLLQRRLDIGDAQLLDLRGGCSASIQALNVATMLVESGRARSVLIVSSECTSQYYLKALLNQASPHYSDVVNGLLFADGASAVMVESEECCRARGRGGLTISYTATKSCFAGERAGFALYNRDGGGIDTRHDHRAIRKTLPQVVGRAYEDLFNGTGQGPKSFDVTIIPQVNQSMIDLVTDNGSGLPKEVFCYYGNETGNIPAAAMFMALDIAQERGRIKPGHSIGVLSVETTSWNYAVAALKADENWSVAA